jgi:glyoxylase-like metal-dependent hydrolase (beta-lactamase superfamily II)
MEGLGVLRIDEGLWRWTAPHPEWKPEQGGPEGWERMVGSVYCETDEGIVLIDPLIPPVGTPESTRLLAALDRDLDRAGRPVAILLANHYHVRSADALRERYAARPGAEVWAHAESPVGDRATRRFGAIDPLPGGIRALPASGLNPGEVVFHLPAHRALVPADALLGAGPGRLRLAPRAWAADPQRYDRLFRDQVRDLLAAPVERVLVSHGSPVLERGARALEEALR